MSPFFVSKNEALHRLIEEHLEGITSDVLHSLPQDVVALVLGGGYGRGEGGVLVVDEGAQPYNDYDLVLVHQSQNERALRARLHEIHLKQTRICGIHVDITPLRFSLLSKLPHTLTWYELAVGHKVLWGPTRVLLEMGPRRLEEVPHSEWGRLLFNRGSGLLYSLWFYQEKDLEIFKGETFETFTTRQVAKAWLALGDASLAARGLYDPSVRVRKRAWLASTERPFWSQNYLDAISFKHQPVLQRDRAVLIDELKTLCTIYSTTLSNHVAAEPRPLVAIHATLRYVRASRWLLSQPWRYPRERLRLALATELGGDISVRERLIGTASDYLKLWTRYG